MSANPLQGIQVINSVNPCSSTPLHRPTYPYYYRGCPPFPSAYSPPLFSSSTSITLSLPLSLFLFLRVLVAPSTPPAHLESRFTSPRLDSPSVATPGKSRKLRLQRLFWHRLPRLATLLTIALLVLSQFLTLSVVSSSFHCRNLPVAPLSFSPPSAPSFYFFFFFFYFSFLPVSYGPSFPPAISSFSARGALLFGLKL